jgi:riboflavin kinase / FMN adenylyltransferase
MQESSAAAGRSPCGATTGASMPATRLSVPDGGGTVRISSVVEHGDHRGRSLGFPTANLYLPHDSDLPADGVYGGFARLLGRSPRLLGAAAISVGTNPTFGQHVRRLEAHILDFDEDIYGELLEVELHFYIRGMLVFASVDDLITTMSDDVARCRTWAAARAPFA